MGQRHFHRGWAWLTATWLAYTAGVASAAEPETKLAWKLRTGQTLQLRILQNSQTETVVKAKPLAVQVDMLLELRWQVDAAAADGTAHISQSFTRFAIRTTVPDAKPVQYDSASTQATPHEMQELSEAVRQLLGCKCQLTMSARGEITDVKPATEVESLLRNLPNAARVLRMLTREGVNGTLRPSLGLLPTTPVTAGQAWKSDGDLDSPSGKVHLTNTFTYRGPARWQEQTVELVESLADVAVDSENPFPGESNRSPRQQFTGKFYFDAVAGRLVRSELRQSLTAEAPARDKKVQLRASNTVILTLQ